MHPWHNVTFAVKSIDLLKPHSEIRIPERHAMHAIVICDFQRRLGNVKDFAGCKEREMFATFNMSVLWTNTTGHIKLSQKFARSRTKLPPAFILPSIANLKVAHTRTSPIQKRTDRHQGDRLWLVPGTSQFEMTHETKIVPFFKGAMRSRYNVISN